MLRSYIIIIKFILILNIFFLIFKLFIISKNQTVLQTFNITPHIIITYIIISYIIVNILKEYENRNQLFYNCHHFINMNYTVGGYFKIWS